MKVKELINELSKFDKELEVVTDYDDYASDIRTEDIEEGYMTPDHNSLISPPKSDSIKIVVIR